MKFNHIAGIALLNLDKTHWVVFFRFVISFHHKNRNIKKFSKSHRFTREGIQNSSRAGLRLAANRIWPVSCRLPMYAHKNVMGLCTLECLLEEGLTYSGGLKNAKALICGGWLENDQKFYRK